MNLRSRAKSTQAKQQNRPHTQDNRPPANSFAGKCSPDLTEPGKDVQAGSNTSLGASSRDTDLIEDDGICFRATATVLAKILAGVNYAEHTVPVDDGRSRQLS